MSAGGEQYVNETNSVFTCIYRIEACQGRPRYARWSCNCVRAGCVARVFQRVVPTVKGAPEALETWE